MKTSLLCAICCVALLACGKNEPVISSASQPGVVHSNQSASASPASAASAVRTDALKIKGLYIGMDISGAPDAIIDMMAEQKLSDFGFTQVLPVANGGKCVLMYSKDFLRRIEGRLHDIYEAQRARAKVEEEIALSCISSDGVLAIKSGADNKVSSIEFNDVRDIFGAKDLTPASFARKLASDYPIPEMKTNEAHSAWSHVTQDGTRVEVSAKEILGIPIVRLSMSRAAP